MSPRRAPGGPRSGPRAPKTAPRAARSAPRGAQDHPGPPQESTQRAAQTNPSGAHFGLILGPLGIIFEPSRRPFRTSRAVRSTDESTGRNHWSKGLSRPLRARCTEAIVH